MHIVIADHDIAGDSLRMLFLMVAMWVPAIAAAMSCLFSSIAWRKRKERGFRFLALGFGFSALFSLAIAVITSSRGAGALSPSIRFVGWIGPAFVLCGCWR